MSNKPKINLKLEGLTKAYDVTQAAIAQNEEYGKNSTLIGEKAGDIFAGIKSLDTMKMSENDVLLGEGIAEITDAVPNISGLIDQAKVDLNYSTGTINANLDSNGFVAFDSAAGFATSISGNLIPSSVATIIQLLTGLLSSGGFDKLTSGGGLPSIQDVMDTAKAKATDLINDVKDGIADLGASVSELADIDKVAQKIDFGNITDVAKKISSVPGINPDASLKDTVDNFTGIGDLASPITQAKNSLDNINNVSNLVKKAKDAVGTINNLKNQIENLDASSLLKTGAGLLKNGVLQDVNESVSGTGKNFLDALTGNSVNFSKKEAGVLLGKIADGSEGSLSDVVKSVVSSNSNISDRGKELLGQIIEPGSTNNLISQIQKLGKQQGYSSSEINALIQEVETADTAIRNYDTTISGSVVIEAPLYDEPILLSDAENKWNGSASGDDVFTYVSSVEELEVEMNSINREITEVVVHATETHTNKNIGSEEIHFIHNELGHDGIGYHYVIRRDGRLQRGRPVNKQGEHASVNNHDVRSIGIVLVGGLNISTGVDNIDEYRSAQSFTREQFTTLEIFLSKFYQRYPGGQVFGHNSIDVNELDPYFDVVDYVESIFRKRNTTTDPLNSEPLKPSELNDNK